MLSHGASRELGQGCERRAVGMPVAAGSVPSGTVAIELQGEPSVSIPALPADRDSPAWMRANTGGLMT